MREGLIAPVAVNAVPRSRVTRGPAVREIGFPDQSTADSEKRNAVIVEKRVHHTWVGIASRENEGDVALLPHRDREILVAGRVMVPMLKPQWSPSTSMKSSPF